MALFVKRRHESLSRVAMDSEGEMWSVIPKRERDAWVVAATMDHSDIRGLDTAFHHFFAGLPRSRDGDHPQNRVSSVRGSHKSVEDSPHRSHASRSRFGMWPGLEVAGSGPPAGDEVGARTSGPQRYVPADIPDKAGEVAGDGDADLVWIELASHSKTSPTFGQTQLGLPGDVAKYLGLALLAHLEGSGDLCLEAIGPSGLHQDAPRVFVAAFGDGTLATAQTARVLRGHQSEVGHERTRMFKPRQIPDLGDKGHCCDEVQPLQTHQRFDQGVHAPALAQLAQRLGSPLNALARLFAGQTIFIESDLLRRLLEADGGEVAFGGLARGAKTHAVTSVTQQHRLHLQPHPQARRNRILAGARQISHCLVPFIRHEDAGEIGGTP